jgi:hypothetical protein
MKRLFLTVLSLSLAFGAIAQKKFDGTIVYAMEVLTEGIDPQQASMMPTEKTLLMKGDKVKELTEAAFGTIQTFIDSKTIESTTCMDIMGNRMAFKLDKANIEEMKKKSTVFEYNFTSETKEILGYKCKKAVASNEDEEVEFTIWYCEDLPKLMTQDGETYDKINGMLMEYTTILFGGVEMKCTAKSIKA